MRVQAHQLPTTWSGPLLPQTVHAMPGPEWGGRETWARGETPEEWQGTKGHLTNHIWMRPLL